MKPYKENIPIVPAELENHNGFIYYKCKCPQCGTEKISVWCGDEEWLNEREPHICNTEDILTRKKCNSVFYMARPILNQIIRNTRYDSFRHKN